jgi:hypothetical protein
MCLSSSGSRRFLQGAHVTDHPDSAAVKAELDRLTNDFFRAVPFEEGATPLYESIYGLFIEAGLLIKNTSCRLEDQRDGLGRRTSRPFDPRAL